MTRSVFVSYGHGDLQTTDWLQRVKLYLATLRRDGALDVWDDTRISAGSNWRADISRALDAADVAVLLVGPAFLGSEFIGTEELPRLLRAATTHGTKVFPLVVGYCPYERSALEPYQSFNPPNQPLEALPEAERNKVLNDLALAVDAAVREVAGDQQHEGSTEAELREDLLELRELLGQAWTAYRAQCNRRDELHAMMSARLRPTETLEYERFFFRYFEEMTREEKFLFDQIRSITEGLVYQSNRSALEILERHPDLIDDYSELASLRQHLVVWLNKFDRVFTKADAMCLVYVGVEDGVPFPSGVDQTVERLAAGLSA